MTQKRFIAVHAVQLIVDGELATVKPSFPLTLEDDKQINHLMTAGAIREPEENELRLFKDDTLSGSSKSELKPAAGAVDISKLTKAQLIELAAAEQIEVDPNAKNAELVKAIEDGRKAKADAETDGLV